MDLWDSWAAHYGRVGISSGQICMDGAADDSLYDSSRPRLLFVLKESNQWPGGDIRELMRAGPKFQVFHTLARWAAGIRLGFPPYVVVDQEEVMRDALRSSAVVNLKKATGDSTAWMRGIHAYAYADRTLLRRQIAELRPEVVVACGTYEPLVRLLEPTVAPSQVERGWFTWNGAKVLAWRHPNRANNRRTYEELRALFQECALSPSAQRGKEDVVSVHQLV